MYSATPLESDEIKTFNFKQSLTSLKSCFDIIALDPGGIILCLKKIGWYSDPGRVAQMKDMYCTTPPETGEILNYTFKQSVTFLKLRFNIYHSWSWKDDILTREGSTIERYGNV